MSVNLALTPQHAHRLVAPYESKSYAAEPQFLHESRVPLGEHVSEELAFFAEGDAMSARHDEEAAQLARLGRVAPPVKRPSWWRRLFARRQRVAPAILAWE